MWCTYSSICWSNSKRFLSILVVFGKYFNLKKFHKYPKICNFAFWQFTHKSWVSCSSRELNLRHSRLFGKWKFQLWKRLINFFQNMGLLIFGDSFTSHKLNPRLSWLTHECKSQSQKRLRENFQNLGSRDFGNSFAN